MVAKNSTFRANGTDAGSLFLTGTPAQIPRADISGSILSNVSGYTIQVEGNGVATLTGSTVGGNTNQWLRVRASGGTPGLADLTLTNSTATGSVLTDPGSVSNLTMIDSTWNLTGSSNVTKLVNDPSLIDFSPPVGDPTLLSSYKTLTVENYIGEGGRIALNTYLGADGSPSDRLVIDGGGTATGTTGLIFDNTTGPGALTTGDGILVVDAISGGTTAPGAFAGAAVAGPYEYLLFRGGTGADASDDWFLRSTVQSGSDGGGDGGGGLMPNFRQEVSLYDAIPPMAAIYGRHLIDTLHERVGEEEQLRGRTDLGKDGYMGNGAWGRLIGHYGHRDGDPRGIYGLSGPEFDYRFGALQTGLDVYRKENDNGTIDHAGLYFAFGHGEVDVQHNLLGRQFKGGTDSFDAGTIGGYWTRFWENNAYLDGVVQGTWYDVTTQSQRRALFGLPEPGRFRFRLRGFTGRRLSVLLRRRLAARASGTAHLPDCQHGFLQRRRCRSAVRQSQFADRPHRRQGGTDLDGRGGGKRQARAAGDGLGPGQYLARVPRRDLDDIVLVRHRLHPLHGRSRRELGGIGRWRQPSDDGLDHSLRQRQFLDPL